MTGLLQLSLTWSDTAQPVTCTPLQWSRDFKTFRKVKIIIVIMPFNLLPSISSNWTQWKLILIELWQINVHWLPTLCSVFSVLLIYLKKAPFNLENGKNSNICSSMQASSEKFCQIFFLHTLCNLFNFLKGLFNKSHFEKSEVGALQHYYIPVLQLHMI